MLQELKDALQETRADRDAARKQLQEVRTELAACAGSPAAGACCVIRALPMPMHVHPPVPPCGCRPSRLQAQNQLAAAQGSLQERVKEMADWTDDIKFDLVGAGRLGFDRLSALGADALCGAGRRQMQHLGGSTWPAGRCAQASMQRGPAAAGGAALFA